MPVTPKKKIEEWVRELDRVPGDAARSADIERIASAIASFYGFERIIVSPLEAMSLVAPLVRAGMLDERPPVRCKTQDGEEFSLTASGVMGAVRAYFSHKMQELPHPLKLFFHSRGFSLSSSADGGAITGRDEWGVTVIGEESAVAETGIAQIFYRTAAELGLNDASIELHLNAVGCVLCRVSYRTALASYLRRHSARLCARSKKDIKRAPTKILSCADERCRGVSLNAPQILDFLCERCKKQLRRLLEFLDEAKIPYFLDPKLFRDGSWYTEIVFELLLDRSPASVPGALAHSAAEAVAIPGEHPASSPAVPGFAAPGGAGGKILLAEGGRLSHAAALMSGKELSVAVGILFPDNVAAAIAQRDGQQETAPDVFFVQLGDLAKRRSFEILEVLREAEIEARESLGRDSIKLQLKIAERIGARYAVILGQKEALDGTAIVREMASGIQETVSQEKLTDFLKKKLKKT